MNEKAMFADRLKHAMLAAGYEARPSVLEREFNLRYWGKPITFQAVRRWLRGESIPNQDKLLVLSEWLDLDPQALRYGDAVAQRINEKRGRWEAGVSGEEREILRLYLELPVEQRKTVRDVILAFSRAPLDNGKDNDGK